MVEAALEIHTRSGPVTIDDLGFDDRGLIPVVVQNETTGAVLMVAWANAEAVRLTLDQGRAHFFSRSRQKLWLKGETSGHFLEVQSVTADCDRDTLLVRALPVGPTCHLGELSCFEPNPAALELGWLARVLGDRGEAAPEESYTARLIDAGVERVAQKVGEEAVEVVVAAVGDHPDELVEEASDLLYHLLVLLQTRGVEPRQVAACLEQRHRGDHG